MKRFKIIKINDARKKTTDDFVTEEWSLKIKVNKKEKSTLLVSPYHLKDLVYGFLYSHGFIKSILDVKQILISKQKRSAQIKIFPHHRLKSKSISKINTDFKVKARDIIKLMRRFQNYSSEFKRTGGVHSAALCSNKKILIFRDDIIRHNAVDKVIGQALLKNLDFSHKLMLISGRITSEIVLKVIKFKIPYLISISASTDEAIKLARRYNLTLVGFVRDKKMNIYSATERIIYG